MIKRLILIADSSCSKILADVAHLDHRVRRQLVPGRHIPVLVIAVPMIAIDLRGRDVEDRIGRHQRYRERVRKRGDGIHCGVGHLNARGGRVGPERVDVVQMQRHVEHAVAAAEHEPVGYLVCAAHARRPVTMLVEVQRVHNFTWSGPQHGSARIDVEAQRAAHAVDVPRHLIVVDCRAESQRHGTAAPENAGQPRSGALRDQVD
jgi:hypothetical protein